MGTRLASCSQFSFTEKRYILSPDMGPQETTSEEVAEFRKAMDALRGCGRVPLGILAYNVEKQEFTLTRFPGIGIDEVDVLLKTIKMQVTQTGTKT